MRYAVITDGTCNELVCESATLCEGVRAIERCFDDEEHGTVHLIVYRLNRNGSFDGRTDPAYVSYDHGSWFIYGSGVVSAKLRFIVDQL